MLPLDGRVVGHLQQEFIRDRIHSWHRNFVRDWKQALTLTLIVAFITSRASRLGVDA